MADRQLELALRIKADLDEALKALRSVEKQIDDVGDAAKRANGKLGKNDVARAATGQAEQLAKAAASIRSTSDATDVLASASGRAALSMGATGVAVGGVVALLGLYAAAVYLSYKDQQLFERSLITSGNAIGATAGQLAEVRDQVGGVTGNYGDATTAVASLASSGKIAADTLAAAVSGALSLSELTGDSIESTTAKIIALADAPTKQLQALNEQYNFLTFEVYEHVKSLEAQGRAQDAARTAVEEFARVHEQRVQEAYEKAGVLERRWIDVKNAVSGAWREILNVGRDDTQFRYLDTQRKLIAGAAELKRLRSVSSDPERDQSIVVATQRQAELAKQYRQLQVEAGKERADAESKAAKQQLESNAIAAEGRQSAALGQDKAIGKAKELKQLERDIAALRAKGIEAVDGLSLADVESKRRAQIDEKYKGPKVPKGPKPPATAAEIAEKAGARELDNLQKQVAMLGELEEGERKASEAARIRYEIESGAYRNASPALQEQLKAAAAALDNGRQQVEVAKELVNVKLRTMQLQGRGDEAQLASTIKELERLRIKLIEVGKLGEAADVAKLMNLERAKSELGGLQKAFDAFFSQISAAEQRVNIDRENGLISSVEAQERLLALRQQEIAYLQQQIPLLEQQNAILQDPAVAESLEQMKLKLYDLQQQGSLLETTFRNTFEFGLANALEGLATGTLTLKEALNGLILDLISGMARLAAQQLASIVTAKLMAALFKGKGGGEADVGAGASKLSGAAVLTAAAGGAIVLGANQLSSSAKELAAAATLMIVANSIGGFADGGYTGDGGKYQIAGFVHKGEGVLTAEEIRALGGPRGFYALRHAISSGYAEGGLVDAPMAMATPRYEISAGSPFGELPTPLVNMRNINLFDLDEAIRQHFSGPAGDKTYLNMVGRNSRAARAGA